MEMSTQNTVLLELHVPDFQKVKDFYGKLGFSVVWKRSPEEFKVYLILKRDNNILCFWAGNDKVWEQDYFKKYPKNSKRGFGVEIVLMIENVEKFYEEVKSFTNLVTIFVLQNLTISLIQNTRLSNTFVI